MKTMALPMLADVQNWVNELKSPSISAGQQRPAHLAETTDDDDEEGVDDVERADLAADRADHRDGNPGDAGEPGSDEERRGVDAVGREPRDGGEVTVLGDGSHAATFRMSGHEERQSGHHDHDEGDDEQSGVRHREPGRIPVPAQPRGCHDVDVGGAEDVACCLLEEQGHAERDEQGVERARRPCAAAARVRG